MKSTLLHGDCREVLAGLPAASADSVVTDPPYELGFMSHGWDSSGIAYDVEVWRHVLRVLKPGGYLLAFGAPRNYHRMACAIEDAGFTIRDSLMWMFGTGFPKGKACLKPGYEPIVLACKGKPRVLNVDGCRLTAAPGDYDHPGDSTLKPAARTAYAAAAQGWKKATQAPPNPSGRWPPNVLLSEEAAQALDAQSGDRPTSKPGSVVRRKPHKAGHIAEGLNLLERPETAYGDSGGASRFFYCAKASRRERGQGNTHSTVKPLSLMRWLCKLVTPPAGLILDPFMGSGTTGLAARAEGFSFIGIEREAEYLAMARRRMAEDAPLPEAAL